MKRNILIALLTTLILVGCSSAAEPTPAASGSVALDDTYPDALSIRSQLMLGTLELETTELAVTGEQAAALLPLWQASRSLARSGTGATAEIDALLAQIEGAMTPEQIQAIAAMALTRADNQAIAQELGLATGTGEGEGAGSGQRGQGQDLSADERATRQAEKAESATGGTSDALLNYLIDTLESKSNE